MSQDRATHAQREAQDTGACAGELCLGSGPDWRRTGASIGPKTCRATRPSCKVGRRILESGAWPTGKRGLRHDWLTRSRDGETASLRLRLRLPASPASPCAPSRQTVGVPLGWGGRTARLPGPLPTFSSSLPLCPAGEWLAAPLAHFLPSSSLRAQSPQIASYQQVVFSLRLPKAPQVPV